MDGGEGHDTYVVDDLGDVVSDTGTLAGANDTVRTVLAVLTLGANLESLMFDGAGTFRGTGNGLDNFINGGADDDSLLGQGGNDTLVGGSGADVLMGDSGADSMVGGVSGDFTPWTMLKRPGGRDRHAGRGYRRGPLPDQCLYPGGECRNPGLHGIGRVPGHRQRAGEFDHRGFGERQSGKRRRGRRAGRRIGRRPAGWRHGRGYHGRRHRQRYLRGGRSAAMWWSRPTRWRPSAIRC
ncbi:MAG: calcium-binding protein [Exiguobacterium profundum]|nr:MAG: calcium-binding protein [Exiguobacterium profundum]